MKLTSLFSGATHLFTIKEDEKKQHSLDVAIEENYSFESEATTIALQDNSIVTDHIINKPVTFNVSGLVSDNHISEYFTTLKRSKEFYENLKEIREQKQLLNVITGLDEFKNVILIGFRIARSAAKDGGLFVDLSFMQLKIVNIQSKTIDQDKLKKDIKAFNKSAAPKGTVQSKVTEKGESSLAYQIRGFTNG